MDTDLGRFSSLIISPQFTGGRRRNPALGGSLGAAGWAGETQGLGGEAEPLRAAVSGLLLLAASKLEVGLLQEKAHSLGEGLMISGLNPQPGPFPCPMLFLAHQGLPCLPLPSVPRLVTPEASARPFLELWLVQPTAC